MVDSLRRRIINKVFAWQAAVVAGALALSRLGVHSDLSWISWVSNHVAQGHWNPYQAIFTGPYKVHAWGSSYPPLTYLIFGVQIAIGRALFGLFEYATWSDPRMPLRPGEVFFLRLLYVPFLLLIGWTAGRFYQVFFAPPEARAGTSADNGWLARLVAITSPIALFVTFTFGQFDIMPTALTFLGLYLLCRGRVFYGVLAVFGGVWLKSFPAVFLLLAIPVLIEAYGWKRTLGSVAFGVLVTIGIRTLYMSDGFKQSFLEARFTSFDVMVWAYGPVRITLTELMLVALMALSLSFATLRTRLETWQKLVLLYALSHLALLAPRYWMPQYMMWAAPCMVLCLLAALPLLSALPGLLYLGMMGAYLFAIPPLFANNVDQKMFAHSGLLTPTAPSLAARLGISSYGGLLWGATSVLMASLCGLLAWAFWRREAMEPLRPRRPLSPRFQLISVSALSAALFVLYMGMHMANLVLPPPPPPNKTAPK